MGRKDRVNKGKVGGKWFFISSRKLVKMGKLLGMVSIHSETPSPTTVNIVNIVKNPFHTTPSHYIYVYNSVNFMKCGFSSFGRAPALQAGGMGFDSPKLHVFFLQNEVF